MIWIPQYATIYSVITYRSPILLNKTILIILFGTFFNLFAGFNPASAQEYSIRIHSDQDFPEGLHINSILRATDSVSVLVKLRQLRSEIVNLGYLTAGFNPIIWKTDTAEANLEAGNLYEWARLKPGNVPEEYLSQIGFREKLYRYERFSPRKLADLYEKTIRIAESNGYPFASIHLDSISIASDEIEGVLQMDLNQFTRIDSLILKGDVTTNRRYIKNYLGIQDDMPYDQDLLDKIPVRLKELPFIKIIKPYEVGMRPGKADIYLYLNPKGASNFNGILGILPDNETGKTQITGDVELNLLNSLKHGEAINLKWQRLQTRTQQLDLHLSYPYILNTPIGTDIKFNLYRQDTIFSQVNAVLGLQYFFKGGNKVNLFYENHQANVISAQSFSLDKYIDSRTNMFGVGIETVHLDYRFNPTKGYFIDGSVAAGKKKILKNPEVEESAYEGINTVSDIYNLNLSSGIYLPFGGRSTVLLRIRSASIVNENIFQNEVFRIGGLKTLRGFDEQSIYASSYGIGTIEYRFILEENSNFFVFFDQGIYENRSVGNYSSDTPFGFGAGINFETKPGIFSFTYALGKQFDNQILLRNGKIHFGFISFF